MTSIEKINKFTLTKEWRLIRKYMEIKIIQQEIKKTKNKHREMGLTDALFISITQYNQLVEEIISERIKNNGKKTIR